MVKKKTLSPAARRQKGHNWERARVAVWKLVFPEVRRGYQYKQLPWKEADLEGTPFRIECKKEKNYPSILGALRQAQRDSEGDTEWRPPLSITAKDRTTPIVSMFEDDFLRFMEIVYNKQ